MAQGHRQGVHLAARSGVLNDTMTSSAGELLNWMALLLMTGDHVAKLLGDGCFPVVSELGRIAFPLFALVLAYTTWHNLAPTCSSPCAGCCCGASWPSWHMHWRSATGCRSMCC
ncbi:TraX family protein [Xanthomonas translucens]|uniref:TraX family protein n=1 Tax=Xanthomonas campestris pv. translucens TaxID=343 RepID=UPI003075AF74